MAYHFNPKNSARLDSPERRKVLPPRELLKELGLKKGDAFLDVGAGTGYFTFPALEIIGSSGQVMAVDISAEMVQELLERAKAVSSCNLDILFTSGKSLPVFTHSVDFALAAFVLHEADDQPHFLREIRRVLKPGGKLAIVEWEKIKMEKGPHFRERLSMDDVKSLLSAAGFRTMLEKPFNPLHYYLTAEKAE